MTNDCTKIRVEHIAADMHLRRVTAAKQSTEREIVEHEHHDPEPFDEQFAGGTY